MLVPSSQEPILFKANISDLPLLELLVKAYNKALSEYDDGTPPKDIEYLRANIARNDHLILVVKLGNKAAGFILAKRISDSSPSAWLLSEIFVVEKFQRQKIGLKIVTQLWNQYPGCWKLYVRPNNIKALNFWRKTISFYTNNNFDETVQNLGNPFKPKKRIVFDVNT